jgi:hypothetical protein
MLKRTKAQSCAFLTLPAHRSLSARPVGGEASLPSELVLAALLLRRTSDLAKLEVLFRNSSGFRKCERELKWRRRRCFDWRKV